jgi:hypothetical protein
VLVRLVVIALLSSEKGSEEKDPSQSAIHTEVHVGEQLGDKYVDHHGLHCL